MYPTIETTADLQGASELADSELYGLLADERRRATLEVVSERSPPVELESLATAVARLESDAGPEPDERTVERVVLTLHHVHLPKMDEMDLVDYDPVANRVTSCPSPRLT